MTRTHGNENFYTENKNIQLCKIYITQMISISTMINIIILSVTIHNYIHTTI